MSTISFTYKDSCLIETNKIEKKAQQLLPEIEYLQDQIGNGYATHYGSVNLPADNPLRQSVATIVTEKKKLNPSLLIVCGIGGSNLGTLAITKSLYGNFYNDKSPIKIYFADTVDANYIQDIVAKAEQELQSGNTVLLNVVTKSGTTTETIANFEIFLNLLQQYHPDNAYEFVVATTDHNSPLDQLAQKNNISTLYIPEKVGGRYSVFSPVGQFPLSMIGIDSNELLKGARDAVQQNTKTEILENPAALSAIIKYEHYKNNAITINDLFLFAVQLEDVGKWYRQLMGESLGKEFDTEGNKINAGITPTVSLGSSDLHSIGQLYLGGPYDKFITFLNVETYKNSIGVPNLREFDKLVANIQGKPLTSIMDAIMRGVKTVYKQNHRPFCSLALPTLTPYYIGQLLQMYMIEIMYLGFLLKVNPFDQPNVELYKEETRKLL